MANDTRHTISVDNNVWKHVKDKAGTIAISKIIRTLLVMWLDGDVDLTIEDLKR